MISDRRTSISSCVERMLADGSYERHVGGLIEMYRRKCGVFLEGAGEVRGAG